MTVKWVFSTVPKLNVRESPKIADNIVSIMLSSKRYVGFVGVPENGYYPIEMYDDSGDKIEGWVSSEFVRTVDIPLCQSSLSDGFVDLPIVTHPTIFVSEDEREFAVKFLRWVSDIIESAPSGDGQSVTFSEALTLLAHAMKYGNIANAIHTSD